MGRNTENKDKEKYTRTVLKTGGSRLLFASAVLISALSCSGCGEAEKETAVHQEIIVQEISKEDEKNIQEAGDKKEDAKEDGDIPIVAEVAEMDDEEDPQEAESIKEDGAGAQTDISTVIKGANETGDISFGIDVAKWQGTIDWEQAAGAGVEFAMIRLGYRTQKTGVIMEDPLAKYNMQQAKEAGIKLGAYFFSTAVSEEEAKEEAAWVAGFISRYPITYPVAYNCEGFQSAESRQYGMDKALRSDCAIAFLDYIQEKGYTPMFYASKNEMEGNVLWDTDRLASRYKIWVSQYPDVPYPQTAASSYTGTHQMWQYTSQGTVPGIGKGVDMNVAYFSYSEAAGAVDDTPYEMVEADPEALLNMTEVNEQVTAKIETNLRSVPSTADDAAIVGKLTNGETAVRTGISANGWSRLEYNGEKVYAVSSYLTTDLGYQPQVTETVSNYQPVSEVVTAKNITNLRSEASSAKEDTIVAVLHNGETVTRTGIGNNGWSQVNYNGQILYAISSYLTTDMGYVQTEQDTSVYMDVNESVTPKIECNLRSEPGTQNDDTIVATIKNGDVVTRTGINVNTGWSRLDYNGQVVYAVSSYLIPAGE